jgi:hypothetical protein
MKTNFLIPKANRKTNSYLQLFDKAWQNLRIWKEEQGKKRIEKNMQRHMAAGNHLLFKNLE